MMFRAFLVFFVVLQTSFSLAEQRPYRFDPGSFGKIVEARRGEPFVVVVWSLDCEYCLESFKALKIAQRHTGLKVVSIATDRADDAQANRLIGDKIRSSGLLAESWAFGSGPTEKLRYEIDPKWRGEMPRSYWFDGQGVAVAYSGLITTAIIDRFGKEK